MRIILLATAIAAVSACVPLATEEKASADPAQTVPISSPGGEDCYTVVLFEKVKVQKPDPKLPDIYNQFLGKWGGGAWNGFWCHDLLVYQVHADGRADVYEMHGPYEPWKQPATAFKRQATIDKEGWLRYQDGADKLTYRIVGGRMQATRSGVHGTLKAVLTQPGVPTVPVPRPVRVVQAGNPPVPGT